jgi:hypothetical protein
MSDRTPALVAGARTPMGRLGGMLAGVGAVDLGAAAVRATLDRAPDLRPDYILLGNVVQAGNGQNPARAAAVRGGVDRTVPGITLNDVCLASMSSVALADVRRRRRWAAVRGGAGPRCRAGTARRGRGTGSGRRPRFQSASQAAIAAKPLLARHGLSPAQIDLWEINEAFALELRHRQRARVEGRIRAAKATGLRTLPFDRWRRNAVWLELVLAAQDLTVWTQALLLDGDLAVAEPKTLRYRLLHVAARVVRHARRTVLRLQRTWPWAIELAAVFARLRALPLRC